MAIFKGVSPGQPIQGAARFNVPAVGTGRQAGAAAPITHHTHSMLSQASRNPRLTNIASVSAQLKAHAGRVGVQNPKGSKR
jgi:hypothetical protein